MTRYSVKQLSALAGVSIRTLHLYDEIGLLKPSGRSTAGYRQYEEKDLQRLQQIMFYKEMNLRLEAIARVLDNEHFDLQAALQEHKATLNVEKDRIARRLITIDKTIAHLQNKKNMLQPEELYDGLARKQATEYRRQAVKQFGREAVNVSEKHLRKLTKEQIDTLKHEQKAITVTLKSMMGDDHKSNKVQKEIAKHYELTRKFWGTTGNTDTQADTYAGLGRLYTEDDRYIMADGVPQPGFAAFLNDAMSYFASTKLAATPT